MTAGPSSSVQAPRLKKKNMQLFVCQEDFKIFRNVNFLTSEGRYKSGREPGRGD